jgi:hypothetical protein
VSGITYRFLVEELIDGEPKMVDKDIVGNQDDTFTFDRIYENVFCYGKEVDDFLMVDKNAIYTLHHSAIQEMDRIQLEDREKIRALEDKVDAQQKQIDDICRWLK